MCVLLELDYAELGVSNLFSFSKVIKEKPLGNPVDPPPLVKEGCKVSSFYFGSVWEFHNCNRVAFEI